MLNVTVNTNNQITNPGFAYDAAGNLTNDGSLAYSWDAEGRPKSAGSTTYTYDGDGQRVEKSTGRQAWSYDPMGCVLADRRTPSPSHFA
jgi:uncharacterized protein RhaS with RHS repeats